MILETTTERVFEVTKDNGQTVKVRVRKPNRRELETADFEQSRVFNQALQSQLPTRHRLLRKLREGGLWTSSEDERLETLRTQVARSDTQSAELTAKIDSLAKDAEGKDKEPGQLTADESQTLAGWQSQRDILNEQRVILFTELRDLRIEIDQMLGHTADAKSEEANRNCILACISEIVETGEVADATGNKVIKVTKVVSRVWATIEAMLSEVDVNLWQRIVYEYMTFSGGLPSEWDETKAEPASKTEGNDVVKTTP